MGLIVSGLIGFFTALLYAYILYWLDRYEKEPLLLLGGVFIWGAVIAAGSAFIINTFLGLGIYIFTNSSVATDIATGSIVAPLVEESLKGLAVLAVFLVFRREFDSILDGIIYAGVAALGFAATENTYYIYTYGFQQSGWSGLVSLTFHPHHPGRLAASLLHCLLRHRPGDLPASIRAGLLRSLPPCWDWQLACSLMRSITQWQPFYLMDGCGIGDRHCHRLDRLVCSCSSSSSGPPGASSKNLKKYLAAEVQAGTITPALLRTASSGWLQMFARIAAVFNGKYLKTARFYQVCGEYAHKRRQYDLTGR